MAGKISVRMQNLVKISFKTILVLFFGYTVICAYLWTRQAHYIFRPQREVEKSPAILQLAFEEVYLSVADANGINERMHTWWIPAENKNGHVLLYLHGSALNIGANVTHARRFHRLGFDVFLISYRGYGLSDGDFPSEEQVYTDAQAAWDYIVSSRQIDPSQIFIYGHSIGGAVAIDLAVRHPDAAGLITESTFTSIMDVAREEIKYRFFPLNFLVHQRFDSIAKVPELKVPVLFLHGTLDQYIPFEMSRRLYAHSPEPKYLKLIRGGGHRNSAKVGGMDYLNAVSNFVKSVQNRKLQN